MNRSCVCLSPSMDLLILGGSGRLGSRDFHPDDMIVLLMANAGVVSAAISVPAAS